jgi:hypothetical protein
MNVVRLGWGRKKFFLNPPILGPSRVHLDLENGEEVGPTVFGDRHRAVRRCAQKKKAEINVSAFGGYDPPKWTKVFFAFLPPVHPGIYYTDPLGT